MSHDSRARLRRVLPGRGRQGDLRFLCGFGTLPDSAPDCEGNPRFSNANLLWASRKAAKAGNEGSSRKPHEDQMIDTTAVTARVVARSPGVQRKNWPLTTPQATVTSTVAGVPTLKRQAAIAPPLPSRLSTRMECSQR